MADANDAFGLAHVVRTGWYREVAVKSMDAQTLRMLLVARSQLVGQRQSVANNIRGRPVWETLVPGVPPPQTARPSQGY
jgi:transposase